MFENCPNGPHLCALDGQPVRGHMGEQWPSESARWTAQVNDLIGGAIVTTYPHPLSEHDHRRGGDPEKRGYVIAECMTMADAGTIADLLNGAGIERSLAPLDACSEPVPPGGAA